MNELPERVRIKDIARLADVSVGTVDRVLHGRSGVSTASKKRVEDILEQLNYKPNMYASALASNKKYLFVCLLPQHQLGEYWSAVENGLNDGIKAYSDFNIFMKVFYYDPFDYNSFAIESQKLLQENPDGIILAPTIAQITRTFTDQLTTLAIPYIFLDSNIPNLEPLAFYGQHSEKSGYFAAKMLMYMAKNKAEIVLFRHIKEGVIGSNQQENREIGFRKYMQEFYPHCVISEVNLHPKEEKGDVAVLDEYFNHHPSVNCGITFNSKVYIIGEYLQSKNVREFSLMGYDLLERNVVCLKKGWVSTLIAQQPEIQGYNGIKALCAQLILKQSIEQINYMPIDLLTAENIDFYLKYKP